ncbi:MAG: dihydroorotase [Candidatus Eremiobacteraeota bacterium]|nr:dihydroorotase [Candidatus Eremiobacteraeota bacterium]
MIDPHVHLRDWKQAYKETLAHGLRVAFDAGLDGVFEMPNTDPPLTTMERVLERIALADSSGVPLFHGIFMGLTADPQQVKEAVAAHKSLFPRVVGLKLYAGGAGGALAVNDDEGLANVITVLAKTHYDGVLAVHCEKESLLRRDLFECSSPETYALARPHEAEVRGVAEFIAKAGKAGFRGILHVCHVSHPDTIYEIERENERGLFPITCGITPHHALLHTGMMKGPRGGSLIMNPPLRSEEVQRRLLGLLMNGRIDWIETDHAPHLLKEKLNRKDPLPGVPGLPFYPRFIAKLKEIGMPARIIERVTHRTIERAFGIDVARIIHPPSQPLEKEYDFDPFACLNDL